MVKFLIISLLFLLSGCFLGATSQEPDAGASLEAEVVPHFDEIEALLIQIELAAGLGNLDDASSLYLQLQALIDGHHISTNQQARLHTVQGLLADTLANMSHVPTFTGSDAGALLLSAYGPLPPAYRFVYHAFPSFVGSDALGFHVSLVRQLPADETKEIVRTFFVTDRHQWVEFH